MKLDRFLVPPDKRVKLSEYSTDETSPFKAKEEAAEKLQADVAALADWQGKLYAQNKQALLIVLQALDAAGKDSTIKHVMSGVNPMGCDVTNFKVPSDEELDHDYMWRYVKALPQRGKIGIFNRSHYEEVLVVRVHPELLARQHLPETIKTDKVWPTRFRQINGFERYLVDNGIQVLKFYLHMSKTEQKKRFLARLNSPDKNWKFSESDVRERDYWDKYEAAFEDMLSNTSTEHAPWHVVPADRKWFTRVVVADAIIKKLQSMGIDYPKLTPAQEKSLDTARQILENEK